MLVYNEIKALIIGFGFLHMVSEPRFKIWGLMVTLLPLISHKNILDWNLDHKNQLSLEMIRV